MEGLETYREQKAEIELVISDITIPRMNGIEMIRNIFSTQPRANVILMSGEARPIETGKICAFVQKPFILGQFLKIVKKCLDSATKTEP